MLENLIYGAEFKLFIRSDKTLREVACELSHGLEIREIRIENQEYEPYDDIGYIEVFGFETQLLGVNTPKYDYVFEGSTMSCFREISEKRMHD